MGLHEGDVQLLREGAGEVESADPGEQHVHVPRGREAVLGPEGRGLAHELRAAAVEGEHVAPGEQGAHLVVPDGGLHVAAHAAEVEARALDELREVLVRDEAHVVTLGAQGASERHVGLHVAA